MRAALISISRQPRHGETGQTLAIAGRSLAERQLGFALAAGCRKIIGLGEGASPEAIALRHAAEGAGARFQTIRGSHGLLGAVRAADELLVLSPGLLAEEPEALTAFEKGGTVLTLSSGPGVAAGFERIDLERAWAGALILPGGLVERLADLPDDSDPHAALLRIALQARVPEKRLSDALLGEASWALIDDDDDAQALEESWLKSHLPVEKRFAATGRLAGIILRHSAAKLLSFSNALPAILGTVPLLLLAALAIAWQISPAAGLPLVAIAAFLSSFARGLAHLKAAPFVFERARFDLLGVLPWLVDLALVGCGALAIGGTWQNALFPPLMLVGALRATRIARRRDWPALLGDRALLALAFSLAAAFGLAEAGVMLAGLLIVAMGAIAAQRQA
ncbi:hypothetical protein FHS61_002160 [Altererythrobacter atlanticus]|uniref:Uncharacterized protein n=1 Tax=Croceibacterium atlanticum TaxID=1267766 RepID=A0A0F7KSD6_9SPHN|nr:hypothetical protein [Croceibacterium atlanticum]AKH41670.1 hypothetical protein WYH_00614 [Croceibacterium atlanticum]MBB5733134.1 hypothetical protein [Croceibacterium atlanticum]